MTQEQEDGSTSTHIVEISKDNKLVEKEEDVSIDAPDGDVSNRSDDADEDGGYSEVFRTAWRDVTSDNHLSLFGFRRFRTTHLLNLRFLEAEIDQIDRDLYQAGLRLNQNVDRDHTLDRLGLKKARKDQNVRKVERTTSRASITRLRSLIREYDESLEAFNAIMSMETFSLADNINQMGCRQNLRAYEKFKTRMLRVDLPLRRSSRDPIQYFLRKALRRLWYSLNLWKLRADDEEEGKGRRIGPIEGAMATWNRTYQNTARIAEAVTRFVIGIGTGAALVVPLVVLSFQESQQRRLLVVILFISCFCFLLSLFSKASNYEIMAASAAYAAVLTVLVSNNANTYN